MLAETLTDSGYSAYRTSLFSVSVRPTHLPGPDAKGDGVHLI